MLARNKVLTELRVVVMAQVAKHAGRLTVICNESRHRGDGRKNGRSVTVTGIDLGIIFYSLVIKQRKQCGRTFTAVERDHFHLGIGCKPVYIGGALLVRGKEAPRVGIQISGGLNAVAELAENICGTLDALRLYYAAGRRYPYRIAGTKARRQNFLFHNDIHPFGVLFCYNDTTFRDKNQVGGQKIHNAVLKNTPPYDIIRHYRKR